MNVGASGTQNSRAKFPRAARLLHAGTFDAVFAQKKARRGQFFTLHHRLTGADAPAPTNAARTRIGIVVPKKLLKLAVHRNLIKRIVRETFRQQARQLKPCDLVMRLNSKLEPRREKIDRKAVAADVARLLSNFTLRQTVGTGS